MCPHRLASAKSPPSGAYVAGDLSATPRLGARSMKFRLGTRSTYMNRMIMTTAVYQVQIHGYKIESKAVLNLFLNGLAKKEAATSA